MKEVTVIAEKFVLSISGLSAFATYFALSIILLLVYSAIYTRVTPYKELALIAEGNLAAAYSCGGALLGFAIPLASAVSHSVGILDMIIWGTIALAIQIFTFLAMRFVFPAITTDIPANRTSTGFFLGIVSIIVGTLNAACMTY